MATTNGVPGQMAASWASWMKAGEIALTAPLVIAMRLNRMAIAGGDPKAADRRENLRMGQEKVDAWWEGALRTSAVITRANIAFARLAAQTMTAGATLPLAAFAQLGAAVPTRVGAAVVGPVHSRVRRNHRRLASAKRR
jgi:hypothetical protein